MATTVDRLSAEDALQRVTSLVGDRARGASLNFGQVDFTCDTSDLVEVVTELRDDSELSLQFFTFLTAIDRSEFADEPGGLEVLVHLYSPGRAVHVNIHVPVDAENPACPTLTGVFRGSDWHERETAEMFGIDFEGHPRLVNLYLPEDFEGHPLRRSFKIPTRLVKEWPGAKDPEEAAAGGR